jgi:hypothetical protein
MSHAVYSTDRHGEPTQINVHRYNYLDCGGERITIAIYLGNHQWQEIELEIEHALELSEKIKEHCAIKTGRKFQSVFDELKKEMK